MDKDNRELDMISEENLISEDIIETVGNSVKKIVVPVALTVGLLTNDVAALDMASQVSTPDTNNIVVSEVYTDISAPIILEGEYNDSEEDEEDKRPYKGTNLVKAGLYSSVATGFGAVEGAVGEIVSSLALVIIGGVGKFAGMFSIISILFLGTFKAIYPERSIKEIITGRNVSRVFIATIVILMGFYVLDSITTQKNVFVELGKNALALTVLLLLWFRVFELKGRFGEVMKNLFWGKKGKILFAGLILFNILISIAHAAYNSVMTTNTFTALICFYLVCIATVGTVYHLAKGRMIEDDELENKKA